MITYLDRKLPKTIFSLIFVTIFSMLITVYAESSVGYPLLNWGKKNWDITQNMGKYYESYNGYHSGVDWNLPGNQDIGEEVIAIANGTIVKKYFINANNGWLVAIEHEGNFYIPSKVHSNYKYLSEKTNKIYSIYIHLDDLPLYVGENNKILRGQVIGYITNGGNGPHLHFEIRKNGTINSESFTLFGDKSNYAKYQNGENTGYYKNAQKMVDDGAVDPPGFIENNYSKIPDGPFADVPYNYWAAQYIQYCSENDIITSSNELFHPEKEITRAELLKMAYKAANIHSLNACYTNYDSGFSDVQKDHWVCKYTKHAVENNYIANNTNFYPDNKITRAEAVKILLNVFNLKIENGKYYTKDKQINLNEEIISFKDVPKSEWYYKYIHFIANVTIPANNNNSIIRSWGSRIIDGYVDINNRNIHFFGPNDYMLREQFAKVVTNTKFFFENPFSSTNIISIGNDPEHDPTVKERIGL